MKYLQARERCIFFPEGTTAKQGELLPFHPNLFESAIHADMPVQPFALKYVDHRGEFEDAVDFSGDISMNENVASILETDSIFAELTLLPLIDSNGKNRKDLCEHARKAIISALPQSVQENRDKLVRSSRRTAVSCPPHTQPVSSAINFSRNTRPRVDQ